MYWINVADRKKRKKETKSIHAGFPDHQQLPALERHDKNAGPLIHHINITRHNTLNG